MIQKVLSLPARVHHRIGRWILLPFLGFTVFSVFQLFHIQPNPDIQEILPESGAYQHLEDRFLRFFPASELFIVTVSSETLWSKETLKHVSYLTEEMTGLDEIQTALSITSSRDLRIIGDEIVFTSPYSPEHPDIETLRDLTDTTPLFRSYFLSQNREAFNIYVFPDGESSYRSYVPKVRSILSPGTGKFNVTVFGTQFVRYDISALLFRDVILLCSMGLLLVFLLETFITRSIFTGGILALSSFLPAVWTLSFFPLLSIELQNHYVVVPVFVLAIATSFSIHLYQHYTEMPDRDMTVNITEIAPIVISAGLTTLFGFISLLFTPLEVLRSLGILIIIGILLSFFSALFMLPALLSLLDPSRIVSSGIRIQPGKRAPARILLFFLAMVIAGMGIARVSTDYRRITFLRKNSEIGRTYRNYFRYNGGGDELSIIIDSGTEYGLIDTSRYRRIREFQATLSDLEDVARVLSFTQLTDWINGRLMGARDPVPPEDVYQLGESLELLAGENTGFNYNALISADYSKARILVRFGEIDTSPRSAENLLDSLLESIHELSNEYLNDMEVTVLGQPLKYREYTGYLIKGQITSIAFFFLFLIAFLLLVLRSLKYTLLAVIPTVSGILCFFGLMGWLDFQLDPVSIFTIAAVMGVSNDDILFFLLTYRKQRTYSDVRNALRTTAGKTGSAIVITTLILMAGTGILVFSSFRQLFHMGILTAASFACCTAVTCYIIPPMLYLFPERK